ncbi:MAG TPA: redoxin domain-containing protein [Tepidisphaeraceae bacterium]|jgi:peroxiredoxin
MSSRRAAQFGLFAACLTLVSSLGILMARAVEPFGNSGRGGRPAPEFSLRDTSGKLHSLADYQKNTLVLYFSSTRCPVCNQYSGRIIELANTYAKDSRVQFVAVNTNLSSAGVAGLEEIRVQAGLVGQNFPTLLDPRAELAAKFSATHTPTFFVIAPGGIIRYTGAFDDNRDAAHVKIHYVQDAIASLLADRPLATSSTATNGCSIKQPK